MAEFEKSVAVERQGGFNVGILFFNVVNAESDNASIVEGPLFDEALFQFVINICAVFPIKLCLFPL